MNQQSPPAGKCLLSIRSGFHPQLHIKYAVVYDCTSSIHEAEARGSEVQDHSQLQSDFEASLHISVSKQTTANQTPDSQCMTQLHAVYQKKNHFFVCFLVFEIGFLCAILELIL